MLTKTRSDFRFCEVRGDIAFPSDPHSHQFCEGHHRDATNVEVLIAWLSAGDERRKEIEIASRPTKAGRCKRWVFLNGEVELWKGEIVDGCPKYKLRWLDSRKGNGFLSAPLHICAGFWEPNE